MYLIHMAGKYAFLLSCLFLSAFFLSPVSSAKDIKAYEIGYRDILTINILAGGEVQHKADITVSSQGTVNIPFIGFIKAYGLTIFQLEEKIAELLQKDYFVAPQVNIHIKEYKSLQYYISIEGEVKKPGIYDYQSGLTIFNACIQAGGFTKFAAPNRARIIRNEEEGQKIIKINLNDIKSGKTPDQELKPGDRIHVPETWL